MAGFKKDDTVKLGWQGELRLQGLQGNPVIFKETSWHPRLPCRGILSVSVLVAMGFRIVFNDNGAMVVNTTGDVVLEARRRLGLYVLCSASATTLVARPSKTIPERPLVVRKVLEAPKVRTSARSLLENEHKTASLDSKRTRDPDGLPQTIENYRNLSDKYPIFSDNYRKLSDADHDIGGTKTKFGAGAAEAASTLPKREETCGEARRTLRVTHTGPNPNSSADFDKIHKRLHVGDAVLRQLFDFKPNVSRPPCAGCLEGKMERSGGPPHAPTVAEEPGDVVAMDLVFSVPSLDNEWVWHLFLTRLPGWLQWST